MYLIPYIYESGARVKSGYFISYEADTNEYLVLTSTSETDFEYVMLEVCQTLDAAVKFIKNKVVRG